MLFQTSSSITGFVVFMIFVGIIIFIIWLKTLVVVPMNQIHVITKGRKVSTFDGKGRYWFFPAIHGRTIIPKHVLDIEVPLLKLHDIDKLPFGVEISVKVQVTDPQKAAATLTSITLSSVSKVVEDTVMSAARSVCMERTILDVMKKREEIEEAIYNMVSDSLSKLGLSAIIFDIKNIRDIDGAHVIEALERVKLAELQKNARIAEAIHNNEAIEVELEREKASRVKAENMKLEEERAKLKREEEVTMHQKAVEQEKLKINEQKLKLEAEAERQKKMIEAQAEADAIKLRAQANAESIKMKAEAEAEGVRKRGFAEADILAKKAEAMKAFTEKGNIAGQIKILELLTQAQIEAAAKIAEALGKNNKIMYLPSNENDNLLSNFMPKLGAFLESGMGSDLISQMFGAATAATKAGKSISKKSSSVKKTK